MRLSLPAVRLDTKLRKKLATHRKMRMLKMKDRPPNPKPKPKGENMGMGMIMGMP